MSETGMVAAMEWADGPTGLTAELIERIVGIWSYLEKDGAIPYEALIRAVYHEIVPATAVPTAEELDAMRWWAYNDTGPDPGSPEFDEACERASAVLRAYLERQR